MELESCIYKGNIHHERVQPTQHAFDYTMYFFWLKINELEYIDKNVTALGVNRRSFYTLRTADYFVNEQPQNAQEMTIAAKNKMYSLGAKDLTGDIYFMGQVRALGVFFSPVNFYFHKSPNHQKFDWMLAEVSNTPWNQRHYYLVNLSTQKPSSKEFHVSPFNPMDMQYQWQIAQPNKQFNLALSCIKSQRHFTASMAMHRIPLNSENMRSLLLRMPSTTIYTVFGIYWQALKLILKRTPIYGHPGSTATTMKENNNVAK